MASILDGPRAENLTGVKREGWRDRRRIVSAGPPSPQKRRLSVSAYSRGRPTWASDTPVSVNWSKRVT